MWGLGCAFVLKYATATSSHFGSVLLASCRVACSCVSSLSVYIHTILQDIHLKQKLPIIVGGTSLYIKMFLEGCSGAPPSTPEGQAKVDDVIMGKSWDERSVYVLITSRWQHWVPFCVSPLSWKFASFGQTGSKLCIQVGGQ